jgi:hypothetical protein
MSRGFIFWACHRLRRLRRYRALRYIFCLLRRKRITLQSLTRAVIKIFRNMEYRPNKDLAFILSPALLKGY